ncbi:MAG: HAMP domain-containing methyl-accepting chemotaxis protein [Desulfuromonadaceae bacterium]|nr:HAMP domain-containing methyl-accepting chemotaxis protein [Desulfuromonadaceae bacterium]MDD2849888.1 HAMP domain-containing methyl-accepting chemotaxis protein [Desulfuromonadaceae bacterium]MDD4130703.1 HAMP domain-containing methyl-accepting chemotaxis protein [Desulfuromonadaceae bacterium]
MERGTSSARSTGLTLRTKMGLLSAVAFVGILLVAAITLFVMNEVRIGGAAYNHIQKNRDALESIAQLKSDFSQINSEVQNFISDANVANSEKSIASIKKLTNDIELNVKVAFGSAPSPENKDAISKTTAFWKESKRTLLDDLTPAISNGDILKTRSLMTGLRQQQLGPLSEAVTQIAGRLRHDINTSEQQVATSIRVKIAACVVTTIVVITLIILFSYFITTSVTRPLRNCEDFANTLAGGRLDTRLAVLGSGEVADLAHAMNGMADNLHGILSRIASASEVLTSVDNNLENAARQSASSVLLQEKSVQETSRAVEQINESVREVSGGIDKLSESATETSASSLEMAATIEELAMSAEKLEEAVEEVSSSITEIASSIKEIGTSIVNLLDASTTTASSIAEMDATIKQVEKNAMDSAAISETVRSDAEIGKNAVLEAITGMQAIKASSQITFEVVETLSLRVNDIGTILSVIDEVAEQTNLLALNAAIIAAQAGEHGKGFAVVADEIRELAERTSSSTREIAAVIKGVQEETRRAVDAISRAEESIDAGEKLSQRSGTALEKIVAGVERAGIQVSEIAKATVEQARGSQSIREAMESVEDMVGHIANSSREHSRGTDMITAAVGRMKDLTVHVRTSTREQSRAGNLIAKSTEDVTAMVAQIREACRSQVSGSALISKSVHNIEGATAANSHAAKVMNSAVTALTHQINLLDKETVGFKI